jgi:hypothetical protein
MEFAVAVPATSMTPSMGLAGFGTSHRIFKMTFTAGTSVRASSGDEK